MLDLDPATVVAKGRLQPGRMFLVDTAAGRIVAGRRDQGRAGRRRTRTTSGCTPGLIDLDDLPAREHIVYTHDSVQRRQQTFGYTEEELKILLGADGPGRRRAARLDGHRHADLAAVHPAAAALRLLPPALRAGHQPAAGRDPGGAGHQPVLDDRAGGQPARPGRGELPPDRAALPGDRQRRARQAPVHRRRRRPARLQGGTGLRPLPAARRREGHQGAADRDLPARVGGDRGRRADPRALRPRLHRRPGADPVAAAHRRGAPAPGARADPHPGRAGRRVRRLPRGAPRGGAHRVRRRGGQPVPRLRVRRGPDRDRRADRRRRRRRRSATTSRRSARAS